MGTLTKTGDINPLKQHIRGICHEMIPLRRVSKLQRTDGTSVQPNNANQNGTQNEGILSIEVIPDLAIAIQGTITIHVDVFTTKLEKGGCVLVDMLKGVSLPIICVIGELDSAQDF